ncbi:MAG: FAD-dependent monooxygenase [Deltaproteobacteria bacterium]|nr:FAD-dependent monooxygenase [Deltaproteobacteria bacterium]
MFDVTIIGGGPAGTAAAFDLLVKGLKVPILDKYEFPRKKACAGDFINCVVLSIYS